MLVSARDVLWDPYPNSSLPCRQNVAGEFGRLIKPKIIPTRTKNYRYHTLITRSGTSMHLIKSGGWGFPALKWDPHSSSGCPHQPMTWASPPQQESIMSIMLPATIIPDQFNELDAFRVSKESLPNSFFVPDLKYQLEYGCRSFRPNPRSVSPNFFCPG